MSEININLDKLKSNKAVKCVITVNSSGDPINIESNDSEMDEPILKAFARTGYLYLTSAKSVTRQFDSNERLEVLRIRLKEYEITIVPEEKYSLIVVSNPK